MNTVRSIVLTTLMITSALVLMAGTLPLSGCEYYRVDPVTGKRYEITQQRYKEGVEEGRDSDAWVQ